MSATTYYPWQDALERVAELSGDLADMLEDDLERIVVGDAATRARATALCLAMIEAARGLRTRTPDAPVRLHPRGERLLRRAGRHATWGARLFMAAVRDPEKPMGGREARKLRAAGANFVATSRAMAEVRSFVERFVEQAPTTAAE